MNIGSSSRRRFYQNVFALSMVQVAAALSPLVALPHLSRALGPESWGIVATVQSVIGYLTIALNWGFPLSAARDVSLIRSDQRALIKLFDSVFSAQICIFSMVCFACAVLATVLGSRWSAYTPWVILHLAGVLLTPNWFLSGIEELRTSAAVQVASKLLFVPSVLIFVRQPSDGVLVVACNAVLSLLAGVYTMLWVRKRMTILQCVPPATDVLHQVRRGYPLFMSSFWISLYSTLIPIYIVAIRTPSEAGYFAVADRARQAAQAVLTPLNQSIFPRVSRLFATDEQNARRSLLLYGAFGGVTALTLSMVLLFAAGSVIHFFGGAAYSNSVLILRVLSPLPLILFGSNLLGVQIMIPLDKRREFGSILRFAGLAAVVGAPIAVLFWGALGAAASILFAEMLVLIAMFMHLRMSGFFGKNIR